MKKILILFMFLIVLCGCNNDDSKIKDDNLDKDNQEIKNEYLDKVIESISYRIENGYSGYENIKEYDLVNLTYFESTKDLYWTGEESELSLNLDSTKVSTFISDIKSHEIFNLKNEYINNNVLDDSNWYITIKFTDGSTFSSQGYALYPTQKDTLDQDFYNLTGRYLFKGNY